MTWQCSCNEINDPESSHCANCRCRKETSAITDSGPRKGGPKYPYRAECEKGHVWTEYGPEFDTIRPPEKSPWAQFFLSLRCQYCGRPAVDF